MQIWQLVYVLSYHPEPGGKRAKSERHHVLELDGRTRFWYLYLFEEVSLEIKFNLVFDTFFVCLLWTHCDISLNDSWVRPLYLRHSLPIKLFLITLYFFVIHLTNVKRLINRLLLHYLKLRQILRKLQENFFLDKVLFSWIYCIV